MDTSSINALRVENLTISYGSNVVLKDLRFAIKKGETVAIIGRSGCGKSTLLRGLAALQLIDRGEIWLSTRKVLDAGSLMVRGWEIRREVVFVPQGPSLLPHMTVRNNVTLPLAVVRGLNTRHAMSVAEDIANQLGVHDQLDSYPEELSGGQLQRVQLARAMVLNPKVLLLDEVTASLDPLTIEDVVQALFAVRSLPGGAECAIVIVTHFLGFARTFADRIVFLHGGAILEEGEAKTFFESPRCEETREFVRAAHWLM